MSQVQAITAAHHGDLPRFPVDDLLDHIKQNLAGVCGTALIRSAITGWTKFVAPYTPDHCFDLSLSDPTLGLISMLLLDMASDRVMIFDPAMISERAILHSAILPLWPSIWIWLQMLHKHKLMHSRGLFGTPDPAHRKNQCASLYRTFHSFLLSNPQTVLSLAAMHTEGMLDMIAALWVEEARDPEAFYGFDMAVMLVEPAKGLSPTSDLPTDILDHVITAAGSKDEVVKLLYSRINANLKQLEPDPSALHAEISLILKRLLSSDTILNGAIMSMVPYTITLMVDTLHLLLNLRAGYLKDRKALPKGIFYLPMAVVFVTLRSTRTQELGYEALARLLNTTFFTMVARMALIREPSSDTTFTGILESLLQTICIRFAVHRPLLLTMNRDLAAAFPAGIPGGLIGDVLRTFQSDLTEWTQLEEQYRKGDGVCNIICGDPQGKLRRCAGCSFVCYCSKTCQQRHWRSDHRKLCQVMRNSAKACVGLSGGNLRFLAYAIAHDAMYSGHLDEMSVLRDSFGSMFGSMVPQRGRKPVLVLDYDGGQERPTSRVEINVVDLQSPADIASKFSSRIPELQDVWQQCWGIQMQPDGTPVSSRYILLPVLALIPRGWRHWDHAAQLAEKDSQSVAALLVWRPPAQMPTTLT